MVDGETITFARQQLCLKSIINKLNLMHKNKLELCAKSIPGPGERDNKTADMFVFLSQARAFILMSSCLYSFNNLFNPNRPIYNILVVLPSLSHLL